MLHFASLFDHRYLPRGLALYESLRRHCPKFRYYALCLDDLAYLKIADAARSDANLVPIALAELEKRDADLCYARKNRTLVEYYFTLSPCLPLYLLRKYGLDHICTLDADQLFYADPTPLFAPLANRSVLITAHNFSPGLEAACLFGRFNVSFQVFKNDKVALRCLERWREQCLEWCKDVYDEQRGRFADQKYLDTWPVSLGDSLHVFDHPGVGLAAWNVGRFRLTKTALGHEVNGRPLVLFHFHGFKQISSRWAGNGFGLYHVKPTAALLALYADYWERLIAKEDETGGGVRQGSVRRRVASGTLGRMVEERSLFFRLGPQKIAYVRLPGLIRWILRLFIRV